MERLVRKARSGIAERLLSESERKKAKDDHQGERCSHTRTLIDGFLKHDIPSRINSCDTAALKSNIHTRIGRKKFSI
jgi:hypothetical protein